MAIEISQNSDYLQESISWDPDAYDPGSYDTEEAKSEVNDVRSIMDDSKNHLKNFRSSDGSYREKERQRDRDRRRDRDRDRRRDRNNDHRDRSRDRRDSGYEDNGYNRSSRDDHGIGSGSSIGGYTSREDRAGEKWMTEMPTNTVLLRGLPAEVDEKDIRAELMIFGAPVKEVRLMKNKSTGTSRGFAFVEFQSVEDAQRWMEQNQVSNYF